jgi:hypothetical protein
MLWRGLSLSLDRNLYSDSLVRILLTRGLSLATGLSSSHGLVTRGWDLCAFGLALSRTYTSDGGSLTLDRNLDSDSLERTLLTGGLSLAIGLSSSYGLVAPLLVSHSLELERTLLTGDLSISRQDYLPLTG